MHRGFGAGDVAADENACAREGDADRVERYRELDDIEACAAFPETRRRDRHATHARRVLAPEIDVSVTVRTYAKTGEHALCVGILA
jgi:hypothetical protein